MEKYIFPISLECPQGDPKDCTYDSGGKKHCIHHQPHHNLAIKTIWPSSVGVDYNVQQEQATDIKETCLSTNSTVDTHDVTNAGTGEVHNDPCN